MLTLDRLVDDLLLNQATFPKRKCKFIERSTNFECDVVETENGYKVIAELPGIKKDQIEVEENSGESTITIKVKPLEETEGSDWEKVEGNKEKFLWRERYHLKKEFGRAFSLPRDCDLDSGSANLVDGVLTLSFSKKEAHKPKKILIK